MAEVDFVEQARLFVGGMLKLERSNRAGRGIPPAFDRVKDAELWELAGLLLEGVEVLLALACPYVTTPCRECGAVPSGWLCYTEPGLFCEEHGDWAPDHSDADADCEGAG